MNLIPALILFFPTYPSIHKQQIKNYPFFILRFYSSVTRTAALATFSTLHDIDCVHYGMFYRLLDWSVGSLPWKTGLSSFHKVSRVLHISLLASDQASHTGTLSFYSKSSRPWKWNSTVSREWKLTQCPFCHILLEKTFKWPTQTEVEERAHDLIEACKITYYHF